MKIPPSCLSGRRRRGAGGEKVVWLPGRLPRLVFPASAPAVSLPSPAAPRASSGYPTAHSRECPSAIHLPPVPQRRGPAAGAHRRFHLPRSVKSPAPIAQAAASADLCFVRGSWSCRVFRGRHVPVLITGCLFISMETLPQLTLLLSAKLPSQRGGTGRRAAAPPPPPLPATERGRAHPSPSAAVVLAGRFAERKLPLRLTLVTGT